MKKQILSTLFALNVGLMLSAKTEPALAAETSPPPSLEQVSFHETSRTASVVTGPDFVATGSSIQVVTPTQATASSNVNRQNYGNWSKPIVSYLYENEDGGITRVECTNNMVIVENYDKNRQIIYSGKLDMELPIFGGAYSGKDYNFLVFGQNNLEKSDDVEVIRVVKYTKDWQREGSTSYFAINTEKPFAFGTLRMMQDGDTLQIRTCQNMYNGHQKNLILSINIPDMKQVGIGGAGYCSHSFTQFVVSDTDNSVLLTADHGDAYPRGIIITEHKEKNENGSYNLSKGKTIGVFPIKGNVGGVYTGVSLGGIAVSDQYYLTVGNSVPQVDPYNSGVTRNIFITATSREDTSKTEIYWLTNFSTSEKVAVSTPHLVKIDDNRMLVLYTVDNTINYVYLNGEGKTTSKIYTMEGSLSDCVPILYNDEVVWYYTNKSTPVFCSIPIKKDNSNNSNNNSSNKSDNSSDFYTKPESYEGKDELNSSEQQRVTDAVKTVLGTNIEIASVEKTNNGICIISKSGDVIYSKTDGSLATNEWEKVGKDWYYFGADKKAAKGWKKLGDKWYYLDDTSSKMATGWKKTATGNWYYMDTENGDMKTGWQLVNNKWYYLDTENGDMKTGWRFVNNKWYYMDAEKGDMKTGWQFVNNKWYYMNTTNGEMKNGWLFINDKWYYTDTEKGDMKTGWQFINDKWYYLDTTNGECLVNTTTPDGHKIDENGTWIQ